MTSYLDTFQHFYHDELVDYVIPEVKEQGTFHNKLASLPRLVPIYPTTCNLTQCTSSSVYRDSYLEAIEGLPLANTH